MEEIGRLQGFENYVPGVRISQLIRELVLELNAVGSFVVDLKSGFRLASFFQEPIERRILDVIVGASIEYMGGLASRTLEDQLSLDKPAEVLVSFGGEFNLFIKRLRGRFILSLVFSSRTILGMIISAAHEYSESLEKLLEEIG